MTTKPTFSVVAVYESAETREAAISYCDRLTQQFLSQFDFDVSWWSFDLLQTAESARVAREKATTADLILFAARSEGEVPVHVCAWIEHCLTGRGEREGALVGLLDRGEEPGSAAISKHFYLRRLAHGSGMDYLTQVPQCLSHLVPESLEFYTERAEHVTGLLDEILHQQQPPPVSLR